MFIYTFQDVTITYLKTNTTITKENERKLKAILPVHKMDRKFCQELLSSLYSMEEMAERSVTGVGNRNSKQKQIPKKQITPSKLQFIYGNYFNIC